MIYPKSDEPLFIEMIMVLSYANKEQAEEILQEVKDCLVGKVKTSPGLTPPFNISDALYRVCNDSRIPKARLQKRLQSFKTTIENYLGTL